MTAENIVNQIELLYGRQSHTYLFRLINDAMLEVASKKQHYTVSAKADLVKAQRWYDLPARAIDIIRVEILDTGTNGRYHLIPKLTDSHKILKSDPDDSGTGDLT